MKYIIVVSLLLALKSLYIQAQTPPLNTELEVDTIITGLNVPWEIQWGSDGHIWMTERQGIISRVDPGSGQRNILLDHTDSVYQQGEAGMLGMVLHPDFADTSHVFVVYTYLSGSTAKEKLVRYTFNGTELTDPFILIDDIPANSTHNGSRLIILPDYTLLITTGDAQNQNAAQNTSSLNGKILRLHLNGDIPADNPIAGSPVWSYGHRNAQGLVHAPNGKVYSSEHGPTTDDEINIIKKGANYGWPNVHGFCDSPAENNFCNENDVTTPIEAWTPTIAPSDLIWYPHDAIPEFENSLLMAVLKEKMIVNIHLEEDGTVVDETYTYFENEWGRLRDILVGPEGELYIATNGESWSNTDPGTHSIIKLTPKNSDTWVNKNEVQSLKIYPNPADDKLFINVGEIPENNYHVQIKSITGKVVHADKLSTPGNQYSISINNFHPGMYAVFLISDEHVFTASFLKQ